MAGPKKFASSTDVARLAGVSQSQVSRTFQEGGSVSQKTRAKVLAAAAELDYRPSVIPRIMLTDRSHLVAVAVGGLSNPHNSTALEQLTTRLQSEDWQVLLVHVESGYSMDGAISRLMSYRVDAVISALAVLSRKAADEFARSRVPVISFNTTHANDWVSSISSDNAHAGAAVADLFVRRGARTFGYVSGPADSPANVERWTGFRNRLVGAGHHPPAEMEGGGFSYDVGRRAVLEARSAGPLPEAIFGANDLVAFGVIDELRRLGRSVPDDVLVAGFDNIPSASWESYDLTTMAQDVPTMVDRAMETLAAVTASPILEHRSHVVVPARLIERRSTRREDATALRVPRQRTRATRGSRS
jgi:DNA-binding LacI/PurR family transcriptional regulator